MAPEKMSISERYSRSVVTQAATTYALVKLPNNEKRLVVQGQKQGFIGTLEDDALICAQTPENMATLRQ